MGERGSGSGQVYGERDGERGRGVLGDVGGAEVDGVGVFGEVGEGAGSGFVHGVKGTVIGGAGCPRSGGGVELVLYGENGREGVGCGRGIGIGGGVDEGAAGEGERGSGGVEGEFGEENVVGSVTGVIVDGGA